MKLAALADKHSDILERLCLNGDLYMCSLVFLAASGFFSGFTLFGIPSSLILYASLGRMVALSQWIDDGNRFFDDEELVDPEAEVEKPAVSLA